MEQITKINCVIGIDPGAQGGLAVFIPNHRIVTVKMPKDVRELADFFQYYKDTFKPIVFLEKLSIRPDDVTEEGGKTNMGKLFRIQKMMANYEHLKVLLETSGIPYAMVHPISWQTKLRLRDRKFKSKGERKNFFKEYAQKLYPDAAATLWNADALLIMHFGRWALVNDRSWVMANIPGKEHEKLF